MRKKYRYSLLWACIMLLIIKTGISPVKANSFIPKDRFSSLGTYSFMQSDGFLWKRNFFSERIEPDIEYHLLTGNYLFYTPSQSLPLITPVVLSPSEYEEYRKQRFIREYFQRKNKEVFYKNIERRNSFIPKRRKQGMGDHLFGIGGVHIKAKGSVELTMGVKRTHSQNPMLSESARKRTSFLLDEKIQMDTEVTIGDKVNFQMNYTTEPTMNPDSKGLLLKYVGDEDEIIRSIEGGNVTLSSSNSLIQPTGSLFGIKADLQFGKLRVNTLVAQQKTNAQTIQTKSGVQTWKFEMTADQYDERRHFFLAHYFRDNYDKALEKLPYIHSPVTITRIEVWITNRKGTYEGARNVVAFSDLGETNRISNPNIHALKENALPENRQNTWYDLLLSIYSGVRNINGVNQELNGVMISGKDFEKMESARKLGETEYFLNTKLGYISLKTKLQTDEVLAVSYEYLYMGKLYQVGEFSSDHIEDVSSCIYAKLLKGTSLTSEMPFWDLMMKNVYSLGTHSLEKDKFRLEILCRNKENLYVPYLENSQLPREPLLRIMNLDKSDLNGKPYPDNRFDFIEGYTVIPTHGVIVFPVVEPFGKHLERVVGDAESVYSELYELPLVAAQQSAKKNRFLLRGEYRTTNRSEIQLGSAYIPKGSVQITAGGVRLEENIDYVVNYFSGTVTILNETILASNVPVSVTIEDQSVFSMKRKTMVGLDLNYQLSKTINLGTTLVRLSEQSTTTKLSVGEENIHNTLWGVHLNYKGENHGLTNLLNKIPWRNFNHPSQLSFHTEFAQLISKTKKDNPYTYIDDFESSQSGFDLSDPYAWILASTPFQDTNPLFPEASLLNDINYGKNRSLIAWYYIDRMFTNKNSSYMPAYLKKDKDQLSDHRVREVYVKELFPKREGKNIEEHVVPIFNLGYYPKERGPYNLDAENMHPDGSLMYPEQRWGGIMRKVETTDFEAANIEYLEFWLMDPFASKVSSHTGGELYFNLGEISEDVLKDGKKFFESGIPVDGDLSQIEKTVWGKVSKQQSMVVAFDHTIQAQKLQDVGLNGLSSEEEKQFGAYKEYVGKIRSRLSPSKLSAMEADPFSPFNDPAGDTFSHYRNSLYDIQEADILTRYKRYNGTEGNSSSIHESAKNTPDIEDMNEDNVLNQEESYYEYKLSITPSDLIPGKNHIVNKRVASVVLENGQTDTVTWYQFKIPLKQYDRQIGNIHSFHSIRFMRMYLTGFNEETILRFASLRFIRGAWRVCEQSDVLEVSTVSIEEHSERTPVNYILPPEVRRTVEPNQSATYQQNEQALTLKVTDLLPDKVCGVYKNSSYDLRFYKRIQLFAHAEAFVNDRTALTDGDLSLFLRIGTDYTENYYEYEVPLMLTPAGHYSDFNLQDRKIVWREENQMNFRLQLFTDLKQKRKEEKNKSEIGNMLYQSYDPDNLNNKIGIMGNPVLSDIRVIMMGIKNRSSEVKSAEVWVNELRLTGFEESGGWAIHSGGSVTLSDLGTIHFNRRFEKSGFGNLVQSLTERRLEDYVHTDISASLNLGKLFPEKLDVSIPFYYRFSKEVSTPLYDPQESDIKLSESLKKIDSKSWRDSLINQSQHRNQSKSIVFNNVRIHKKSKTPMPYDPANFSLGYTYNESNHSSPETIYEITKEYQGSLEYEYVPPLKTFRPFKHTKRKKLRSAFELNYLPSGIRFCTIMQRHYYELLTRDFLEEGNQEPLPVLFNSNFSWNRSFHLRWVFNQNLSMNFSSGTNARIEEPYVQVNKKMNPEQYRVWKQTVKKSIGSLGTPLVYDQHFSVVYTVPFYYFPSLNWILFSSYYQAIYNWEKMNFSGMEDRTIGNVIENQTQWQLQGSFNFQAFYNKNVYLRDLNRSHTFKNYPLRFLTMLRRLNIQINRTNGVRIPGFKPDVGDFFGQRKSSVGMSPGLKFGFGKVGRTYLKEIIEKDWLIKDEVYTQPITFSHSTHVHMHTVLEPFKGFRMELNAERLKSNTSQIYNQETFTELSGGNFLMTTVGVPSFMKSRRNLYHSSVFQKFLSNREVIQDRWGENVHIHPMDVLIPSFLAAYTGKNVKKIPLTSFPSITQMLPNWNIMYDGFTQFPFIKNHFKSLIVRHQYRGSYGVPSFYSSSPTSPYQIESITLSDSFTPLIGVEANMENAFSFTLQYRSSRMLNLNSFQLIEAYTKDFLIGVGYINKQLTLKVDFSQQRTHSLIRKIQDEYTQPTGGAVSRNYHFSAEYSIHRSCVIKAFYDQIIHQPLLSNTLYPSKDIHCGVSLRFLFDR